MEKGGSIQQANQAFCLCLCRGGVGGGGERTLHFGSEAAAAGAEKEESEGGRQKHREVGEAERKWRKRK